MPEEEKKRNHKLVMYVETEGEEGRLELESIFFYDGTDLLDLEKEILSAFRAGMEIGEE